MIAGRATSCARRASRAVFAGTTAEDALLSRPDHQVPALRDRPLDAAAAAPDDVLAFFAPLFGFVDEELGGAGVLIHCLAGAHRAGTAGTACLMHLCGLRAPGHRGGPGGGAVIDPIYDFKQLLEMLDGALHGPRPRPSTGTRERAARATGA